MATLIYGFTSLDIADGNSLKEIDGAILNDGDMALGIHYISVSPDVTKNCFYVLDADSGAAESLPDIVAPTSNAGNKRWLLRGIVVTDIEVGNPDTTITRVSAGIIAIEGKNVYMAGGVDVAIADGGTGASTAADAFIALKQAATESTTGVAELATVTEAVAGTDTSRIVTPAGNAASEAVIKNPLQEAQGVEMTYAASGSPGIQVADNDNIDFGTGDFTLVWKGSLPDWTPSGTKELIIKQQDGTHRYYLGMLATGKPYMALNGNGYTCTVATGWVDGTVHELCAVISYGSTVTFYADGIQLGNAVAISALDISNTGALYICGTTTERWASVTQFAATYNRALSAAEVLDLYRNGIASVDKWGNQAVIYASDFSAGVNGWAASNGTAAGNIDGIGGEDDCLRFTCSVASSTHYLVKNMLTVGLLYRVSFRYFIPSGQSNVNGIRLASAYWAEQTDLTTLDAWTPVTKTFVAPSALLRIYQTDDGSITFGDAAGDDVIYIKDMVITRVGATLALEPEGIQPAPGQWLDSSSNKLHAWQPTTGSTITRKKTEFEIRGINTWTASNVAQSIAMTSDASRAMLPANCYIESIVGVVAGADIEDIIIGNGSDTDYWVELTTGLAAGTVSFMLANRISDGTNYELVVTPDAVATMSITWTIKGYILD
jgi:hypothetical protein